VQAIDEQASVVEAARIMAAQHVHHLPVVDHHGRPRGIISTMDILKALARPSAAVQ
jgi:CBS domain-containing protein